MPELPEVETVRLSLADRLCGLTVVDVETRHPDVLLYPSPDRLVECLRGARFLQAARRGKYLLLHWGRAAGAGDPADSQILLVHLRMTGRLYVGAADAPMAPHTHWRAELSDGAELRYTDPRRFGRLGLFPAAAVAARTDGKLPAGLRRLGPEPLADSFKAADLAASLAGRRISVKGALLDQRTVAGLGNIYVDEALYRARLHPARPAGRLGPVEVKRLHRAIRAVLREAIAHRGTTLADYRDGLNNPGEMGSRLQVFGRAGLFCRHCGHLIEKSRVAGRGTYSCHHCQVLDN